MSIDSISYLLDNIKQNQFLDAIGKCAILLGTKNCKDELKMCVLPTIKETINRNLNNEYCYTYENDISTHKGFFYNLYRLNNDPSLDTHEFIIGVFGTVNITENNLETYNATSKQFIESHKNVYVITNKLNYYLCINKNIIDTNYNTKYKLIPKILNNHNLNSKEISLISGIFNKIKINFKVLRKGFNNFYKTKTYSKETFLDYDLYEIYNYKKSYLEFNIKYNNCHVYRQKVNNLPKTCQKLRNSEECCYHCYNNKKIALMSNFSNSFSKYIINDKNTDLDDNVVDYISKFDFICKYIKNPPVVFKEIRRDTDLKRIKNLENEVKNLKSENAKFRSEIILYKNENEKNTCQIKDLTIELEKNNIEIDKFLENEKMNQDFHKLYTITEESNSYESESSEPEYITDSDPDIVDEPDPEFIDDSEGEAEVVGQDEVKAESSITETKKYFYFF